MTDLFRALKIEKENDKFARKFKHYLMKTSFLE